VKIPGARPSFSKEDINEIVSQVTKSLESGILSSSTNVKEFEKQFSNYVGQKYPIATNSGASALEASVRALDIKNSEIIVPTNTFIASPNSIINSGNIPVFADMEEDSFAINLGSVREKITKNTKAVMVVHIAGLVHPKIEELKEFCKEKGLYLIEDCSHVEGAELGNKKAGTFGDVSCFSFYATKVMTSGEGGIVLTNNEEIYNRGRMFISHGRNFQSDQEEYIEVGTNLRMSELNAIVGLQQLKHLEEFIKKRNEIVKTLKEKLQGLLTFQVHPSNAKHSYYKLLGVHQKETLDLIKTMRSKYEIEVASLYYPPCHLQPVYRKLGHKEGECPVAENVLKRLIALPIFVDMTEEQMDFLSSSIKKELA